MNKLFDYADTPPMDRSNDGIQPLVERMHARRKVSIFPEKVMIPVL